MVLTATLTGVGTPAPQPDAEWRVFRDRALGFTFAYPPGWSAVPGCHGNRRCVAVSEKRGGPDNYAIALEEFAGRLQQTATDKSVFRWTPGGWVAEGRFASHPARSIAEDGWRGLEAVIDCGITTGGDVHAATGECLWAVLSDGRISVVADTQGTSRVEEDVRRILRSVRFVPP
jgi:hypothetical protein